MRTPATALVCALLGAGCGASSPRPATHDDFARIQVAEATLDRASHAALSDEAACAARCEGASRADEAARAVCAVAAEVDDADAAHRCDDARRRAREGRAAADGACACPPGPEEEGR